MEKLRSDKIYGTYYLIENNNLIIYNIQLWAREPF